MESLEKQIQIRVTLSLNERLEALARRENNAVSAVTRRLLSTALELEETRAIPAPRRRA